MASFYLDDGISPDLAAALAPLGHFATTAQDQGRKGAPDEAHLWLAAQQGWTLVTQNGADFRMLHRAWLLWGVQRSHAGVLVIAQVSRVLVPRAAQDVHAVVQRGLPLANQLYHLGPRGWMPYP